MTTYFFSKDKNSSAEEFKHFLPVNVNTSYRTLAPAITTAELKIAEIIGKECFEKLASYYEKGSSDSNINETIELLQFAIIRYAYYDSFDQLSVVMSDTGLFDNNGENRVYRYQSDALRESLHRQAFEFIDRVIDKLEVLQDFEQEFSLSPACTISKISLIKNSKEFKKATSLNCDYRLLVAIRPALNACENVNLPFCIGQRLTDELYSSPARFEKILPLIKSYICYKAIADSAEFIGSQLSHTGWSVSAEKTKDGKYSQRADMATLKSLKVSYSNMAENLISQIVVFFKTNKKDFPEIADIGGDDFSEHGADFMDLSNRKILKL